MLLFRSAQPQMANFVRLAKVELVPSADVGGMLKGVGNLTKDALTFKWAQATMKDVAVNTVVVVEVDLLTFSWGRPILTWLSRLPAGSLSESALERVPW